MFGFRCNRGSGPLSARTVEPDTATFDYLSPCVTEEKDYDPNLKFWSSVTSVVEDPNPDLRQKNKAAKTPSKCFTPISFNSSDAKVPRSSRRKTSLSRALFQDARKSSSFQVPKFRNNYDDFPIEEAMTEEMGPMDSIEVVEEKLQLAITAVPAKFWEPFETSSKEELAEFSAVYQASQDLEKDVRETLGKSVRQNANRFCFRGRICETYNFIGSQLYGLLKAYGEKNTLDTVRMSQFFDAFYTCGFRAMNSVQEREAESDQGMDTKDTGEKCSFCDGFPCFCENIVEVFHRTTRSLRSLGLIEELAGPVVYSVISREMSQRVASTCTDKYDASHLTDLTDWLKFKVLPWIEAVYPNNQSSEANDYWYREFSQLLLEIYGKAIINDMFSIIIEFPESQPILEDLRTCMNSASLRGTLVSKLKWDLERRLLNAGVSTNSVLDAYCNCVRALKFVDSSGILVQLVTPPVREYLKHREETVRVILVSLTDESGDLADELLQNPVYSDKKMRLCSNTWNEWVPDPIDVPRDKFNLRKSDLIQALVSIYGSKSLFIDEYRALLADRLLRLPKPGPITREIKCLELLKLRFGDTTLQKCEVMLKDVADSQRLNTRFYEDDGAVLASEMFPATAMVVSAQFWPSFKQEPLKLPEFASKAFDRYTKAFEAIKGNRTLEWQSSVGTVEIELEHKGIMLEFTCNPSQASFMYYFAQKDTWSENDLSEVLGVPVPSVHSKAAFWISKGVLVESTKGNYVLNDSFGETTAVTQQSGKFSEEADADLPLTSASKQREDELQIFWSYIEGMLTNLESLPLERIHSMLKLFATVDCSSEALQKFLDEKVSLNMLSYSGGQYQLPK